MRFFPQVEDQMDYSPQPGPNLEVIKNIKVKYNEARSRERKAQEKQKRGTRRNIKTEETNQKP